MQDLVKNFNRTNEWGIKVDASYQGGLDDLYAAVAAGLESGEPPDLVVGYPYQAHAWDAWEQVVDLTQYVDDPVWGFSPQEQADFYPVFWEQDLSEDRRLGLPAQRSGQVLYYNTTWAKELGFTAPPVTPEQFRQQACAAARVNQQDDDPDNNATGGYIFTTNYSAALGWIQAFGGEVLNAGRDGYRFDTPAVKNAFTFLRRLYDEGCAWLSDSQLPETAFAARQGLFAAGSVMGIPHQAEMFERLGSADQWTVIAFPSPAGTPAINVYGPSFSLLPSTPEQQLAAWLFVKWLVDTENQAQLIEASAGFPLRVSVLDEVNIASGSYPQWGAAVDLLSNAKAEPSLASWRLARWAVYDAFTQLFRYYFSADQVPDLAELLNETAADLQRELR